MFFDPQRYYDLDLDAIKRYNDTPGRKAKYLLHDEMGPAPYDGDPKAAKIVLLFNNPMYEDGHSVPADHAYCFPGWPLAGLNDSPTVRKGFRAWYRGPLGYLIDKYGAQEVSQRVALVQICPWASGRFDLDFELPSRKAQVATVKQAVERGAIVIITRSRKFWRGQFGYASELDYPSNVYDARWPRFPMIKPGPNGLVGLNEEDFDARFSPCFRV